MKHFIFWIVTILVCLIPALFMCFIDFNFENSRGWKVLVFVEFVWSSIVIGSYINAFGISK